MSSSIGKNIKISIFGESHGVAIGVVIDGFPSGIAVDLQKIKQQLNRRSTGEKNTSTRKESDEVEIVSGVYQNKTTGTPITVLIKNNDCRSTDYASLQNIARPAHADFTGYVRYQGFHDPRGGGHFSGRLTAPLVVVGAFCDFVLHQKNIWVAGHIYSVKEVMDTPFSEQTMSLANLQSLKSVVAPFISDEKKNEAMALISDYQKQGDSVGGVVECCVLGLPVGIGSPMFRGLESVIAPIIFAIPAVKGLEFGLGFQSSKQCGSENNDAFMIENEQIKTKTNHHGGILGGISSGMPLTVKVAFKPTPSIGKEQDTVNFIEKTQEQLIIKGRHDPCIVLRAVPVVEAALSFAILDSLLDGGLSI